ncbi:hypothetical protein D7252_11230 [Microbacterium sp. CGR2]|nr:hypothetical protein D7252_11230 [Microbacterium sp. CGR2]
MGFDSHARLAVDAGHEVLIANSCGPESLADLLGGVGCVHAVDQGTPLLADRLRELLAGSRRAAVAKRQF